MARKATTSENSTGGAGQASRAVLQPNPSEGTGALPNAPRQSTTDASEHPQPAHHAGAASGPEASPRRDGTRIPFGKQQQRLSYPTRPGFVGYWFNDDNDRLDRALQAGWDFVRDARTGKPVSRPVGKRGDGTPGGMLAYRMEIPEELYRQDFADAQRRIDEIMAPIAKGKFGAKEGDNRYVPAHTPISFEAKDKLI